MARNDLAKSAWETWPLRPTLLGLAPRSWFWSRISLFLRLWSRPRPHPLGDRIPYFFLEFDRAPGWEHTPCIFLALDWPLAELDPRFRRQAPLAVPGFRFLLELMALFGHPARGAVTHQLARCWRELPAGGIWAHLGILASRPNAGYRLSLLLPQHSLREYLTHIAPHVDCASFVSFIDRYAATPGCQILRDRLQLDIDVSERVAERMGVSLLPTEPNGWPPLLAALVEDGLFSRRFAEGALSWADSGASFPLLSEEQGLPYLSHVKVVTKPTQPLAAKLYFGFRM